MAEIKDVTESSHVHADSSEMAERRNFYWGGPVDRPMLPRQGGTMSSTYVQDGKGELEEFLEIEDRLPDMKASSRTTSPNLAPTQSS